jgi:hypothetical protein
MLNYVDMEEYDICLEPSAGKGAFFNLMEPTKRIGIDIKPMRPEVTKLDYFDFKPDMTKKYIVIGNPPFGKISSVEIQFFNKSAKFADCIAFIIPRTFKRVSVTNRLDMNFELIYNEDLPITPCCFTPKMTAKCCFQIWKRTDTVRMPIVYAKTHADFTFIKHGPKDEKKINPLHPLTQILQLKRMVLTVAKSFQINYMSFGRKVGTGLSLILKLRC